MSINYVYVRTLEFTPKWSTLICHFKINNLNLYSWKSIQKGDKLLKRNKWNTKSTASLDLCVSFTVVPLFLLSSKYSRHKARKNVRVRLLHKTGDHQFIANLDVPLSLKLFTPIYVGWSVLIVRSYFEISIFLFANMILLSIE